MASQCLHDNADTPMSAGQSPCDLVGHQVDLLTLWSTPRASHFTSTNWHVLWSLGRVPACLLSPLSKIFHHPWLLQRFTDRASSFLSLQSAAETGQPFLPLPPPPAGLRDSPTVMWLSLLCLTVESHYPTRQGLLERARALCSETSPDLWRGMYRHCLVGWKKYEYF